MSSRSVEPAQLGTLVENATGVGGCQAEEAALPWVVIESARLWIQVAGMRFLQQEARLTVRDRAKTLDMQNE